MSSREVKAVMIQTELTAQFQPLAVARAVPEELNNLIFQFEYLAIYFQSY